MVKAIAFCVVILGVFNYSTAFSQDEAEPGHKSSFLYKKAKELGFDDYGWLGAMSMYYKEGGERKLKKMLLLVDEDCGRYFRAVQRVGEYVIYRPNMSVNNTCGGREMVAVIPASGVRVSRLKYIEEDCCYYVFQELSDAKMDDGFTTRLPVLKQVRKRK
jgi:hypothetical protein